MHTLRAARPRPTHRVAFAALIMVAASLSGSSLSSQGPQLATEREEASEQEQAWQLTPKLEPTGQRTLSLHFPEPVRAQQVFDEITASTGIEIATPDGAGLAASDRFLTSQRVHIELNDATPAEALRILAAENRWLVKVIDAQHVLVASDTPQNHRRYDSIYLYTFRLENASAKNVHSHLRVLIDVRRAVSDETANTVTVNEPAAILQVARRLVTRLDHAPARIRVATEALLVATDSWASKSEQSSCGQLIPHLEADPAGVSRLRRHRHNRVLWASMLSIIGDDTAVASTSQTGGPPDGERGASPALKISIGARAHPRTDEVTVHVKVTAEDSARVFALEGDWPTNTEMRDLELRAASGASVFVGPLACERSGNAELILVLTPEIEELPQIPEEELAPLKLGTETYFTLE